jgi:uncharacterized membrane protein YsdA (DUF1294 family)
VGLNAMGSWQRKGALPAGRWRKPPSQPHPLLMWKCMWCDCLADEGKYRANLAMLLVMNFYCLLLGRWFGRQLLDFNTKSQQVSADGWHVQLARHMPMLHNLASEFAPETWNRRSAVIKLRRTQSTLLQVLPARFGCFGCSLGPSACLDSATVLPHPTSTASSSWQWMWTKS